MLKSGRKIKLSAIAAAISTAAMLMIQPSLQAAEVNLYSARKEALIKPILDQFTQQTGIDVNLITGKADALLQRLKSEGRNSPADLLITTDAGRLYRAKEAGVLQPIESNILNTSIPPQYRDQEGYWYGLSLRSRPIFYAKDRVDPKDLSTYEDLASEKWNKKICIRSSDNIYNQSLVSSMIVSNGVQESEKWATAFVKNLARKPQGGDRDQIKAVAAGQCDIAVANTYYYGQMVTSNKANEKEAAAKTAIFWPNQSGRGAHVNISGAAVTSSAKNRDNAIKLLEYLSSDAAQKWYADKNFEYPVKSGVEYSHLLKQWGQFKSDTVNLDLLGTNNASAVRLMDRAGWR